MVRLNARVDGDIFTELRGFANELHGYYSTFNGVNGFVFKSMDNADEFGEKLDGYLQIEKDEDDECELSLSEHTDFEVEAPEIVGRGKTEDSNEIIETEEDTVCKPEGAPKSMDAFKGLPPSIEFILKTMVENGCYEQLANYDEWDGHCQELAQKFIFETGFNEDLVLTIFGCIVNGLSLESSIDDFNQELDTRLQKLSPLRPSTRAREEEWDDFLSKRIQWKIDPLEYGIKAKSSVSVDKRQKRLTVFVELNNCQACELSLYATIYDINGLIKDTGLLLYEECAQKFMVGKHNCFLKCSATKINKIVISGEIKRLLK